MDIVYSLISVVGGIALLLFGIEIMSESLKKIAGNKFKTMVEKATNTPLKGVLVGTLVTAITQSSTGVTVFTVGLVRAGLMTLPQSVGIIMGANIGTTFTVLIMGLPIAEFGLAMAFVGIVMSFFSNKKVKHWGRVILGLGMLFHGLELMNAMKDLAENQTVQNIISLSDNWYLGTLTGTLATAVIHSSTAFMGILVKLYSIEGQQMLSLSGALALILGSNIGTTFSSLIASIGGNAESKKTALVHVMFNILGSVIFLIIIVPWTHMMQWMEQAVWQGNKITTLGMAHLIQNLGSTIILFFFIKHQIWIVNKLVPTKDKDKKHELVFEESLIEKTPQLALNVSHNGIVKMMDIVKEYFDLVYKYSFKSDSKALDESNSLEDIIDSFDERIHDYLIKISQVGLQPHESNRLSRNLDVTKDLERIGDHLNNIMDLFEERYEDNAQLSEEGAEDLVTLYETLKEMMEKTFICYDTHDKALAKEVLKLEDKVDELEETFRYKYIERLKAQTIPFIVAANYADILSNMERIGDHLNNIAGAVIEPLRIPLHEQRKSKMSE